MSSVFLPPPGGPRPRGPLEKLTPNTLVNSNFLPRPGVRLRSSLEKLTLDTPVSSNFLPRPAQPQPRPRPAEPQPRQLPGIDSTRPGSIDRGQTIVHPFTSTGLTVTYTNNSSVRETLILNNDRGQRIVRNFQPGERVTFDFEPGERVTAHHTRPF
jgi:hypothetical protein